MQAPWRSPLARALHRNRSLPNARYVQLATIRPDGTPANRTVVFRGFVEGEDQLQFVSDRRSAKISHINHQHAYHHKAIGEVCWYFPKTREQFRLLGHLSAITHNDTDPALCAIRQTLWQSLSDRARAQFAWPEPGSDRIQEITPFHIEYPNTETPLPNFCALMLFPYDVDHLELRGDPQNRWSYTINSSEYWEKKPVNP